MDWQVRVRALMYALAVPLASPVLAPPATAEFLRASSNVASLALSFSDPMWDGETIPKGEQCREFGGNGSSPRIQVGNIPSGASELILAFGDTSYAPCDNGGHGVVSYRIPLGATEVVVPSIPGQTFDLPPGFSLIKEHCGVHLNMQAGAYIGPCPGLGNIYQVTIEALSNAGAASTPRLLGKGSLKLGTYRLD